MQSRRDFLKLLSMAVGASLTGCGGSNTTGVGSGFFTAPISYRFVPVVQSGQTLARGRSFLAQTADGEPPFLGAMMINDQRRIAFHALDDTENRGIYGIDIQQSGATTAVEKIIAEGDVLPDGTLVDEFSDGELNNSGDFLLQVENEEGVDSIQYCPEGGDFTKLAESYQDISTTVKMSGEISECQGLSDSRNLLFVAEYRDEDEDAEGEGLFFMPVTSTSQAQLVIANNDLLPGTASSIQTFGTSEIDSEGNYLIHGSASPPNGGASSTPDGTPLTYLMRGRVGEAPELLAAHPDLGATGVLQGSILNCPRMGSSGVGFILQTDEDKTNLYLNQQLLLEADFGNGGSLSPQGAGIVSMFPPVFGPGGLLFIQVFTTEGLELLLYDGARFRTLLSRGDVLDGRVVEDFVFGALPESVNSSGELVVMVVFDDGESVVMLGLPV